MSSSTRRKTAFNLIKKRKISKRLTKKEQNKKETLEEKYDRAMKGI